MVGAWCAAADPLATVWTQMRMGNWSGAERSLERLSQQAQGEALCAVKFAEGVLWQHRMPGADLDKAAAAYRWVVDRHPQSAQAPRALLAWARVPDLSVLNPQPEVARERYRLVVERYPDSEAAQEAMLHWALAMFATRGREGAQEALQELERWRQRVAPGPYAAVQALVMGRLALYPLEDYRAAVGYLAEAERAGLETTAQQSAVLLQIAQVAERRLADRELAVEYYTKFLQRFPNHGATFMCKQALARLGAPLPPMVDMSLEAVLERGRRLR
jgi:TolA-binding protein